jgi:hypothetical protein
MQGWKPEMTQTTFFAQRMQVDDHPFTPSFCSVNTIMRFFYTIGQSWNQFAPA